MIVFVGEVPNGSAARKQERGEKMNYIPNASKLIARFVTAALFVTAAAGLGLSQDEPDGGPDKASRNARLTGTWEGVVTVRNCQSGDPIATFPATATFNAHGTLLVTESGIPPALKAPAQGVWRRIHGNTFRFRSKSFTFNPAGAFTGWLVIDQTLTLDRSGDSYETCGTSQAFNANGSPLFSGCSTTTATRLELP